MIVRRAGCAILCVLLGTASVAVARADDDAREGGWRRAATAEDRARLRRWREAWMAAIAAMRSSGDTAALAADPALFDPDRVLPGASPPPGAYRCRTTRFGLTGDTRPRAAPGWTPCSIARRGDTATFEIIGTQHVSGQLYAASRTRVIFLGTIGFGDERRMMRYGRDRPRDMAGIVERIATRRWRMVLPYPNFGGVLDLVEIVPQDR